jgi:hypothetical protein
MDVIDKFCSDIEAALQDILEVRSVIIRSSARAVLVRARLLLAGTDYEIEQIFSNKEIEMARETQGLIERFLGKVNEGIETNR